MTHETGKTVKNKGAIAWASSYVSPYLDHKSTGQTSLHFQRLLRKIVAVLSEVSNNIDSAEDCSRVGQAHRSGNPKHEDKVV